MSHYDTATSRQETLRTLEGAYHAAYSTSGEEGTISRLTVDIMDEATMNPMELVNEFYETHADLIRRSGDLLSDDAKQVEETFNRFQETSQTMVKGLTALGRLHPFVGVAVGAFVVVITLDMTRRDNDRKVLAVKVQMQDLMGVFFELRHIRDSYEMGKDGMTIAERLEGLMMQIAKDVKACGSACDAYLKKGFLAKTIKSTTYEARLAQYADQFQDYRKKLELAFSIHSSLGVDSANQKLDEQARKLEAIERKLDMIAIFRSLDSPRERDVQRFLRENGGVKACISQDELLEQLIIKSGESISGSSQISGKETARRTNDLPSMRKKLFKELAEDLDEVLSRNMVLFERKLEMQSKQLTETIKVESDHIISSLLSGAHDRITDPDLQKIWKDMGWKGSVKARHFVLALHDYYTDKLSKAGGSGSDTPPRMTDGRPFPPGSAAQTPRTPKSGTSAVFKRQQDDKWALAYINAAYVQPILEAVDDDGTGFVSVKEVNTFVAERPDGWSLPHWIAYWAVGWQASITRYKNQIYALVQMIFCTLNFVLPSNRRAVDEYLFHPSFWRIELLLRSTRSVNPKILQDPDLVRITESYSRMEEERLERNLADVEYELDTPATVSLVTGEGRIERFAFPLIYLLLKRHLKVITVACKHVLDGEELSALNDSLVSVLLTIDHRVQNLEAVFKQTHLDVQARLGNFAFGIFQLSYGDVRRIPTQNSFATWKEEEEGKNLGEDELTPEMIRGLAAQIPHSILKYGIQDGFSSTDYYEFEPHRTRRVSHALQGTWTGICSRTEGADAEVITFLVRLSIRIAPDLRTIIGKGEDYSQAFNFEGKVKRDKSGYTFHFSVIDPDDDLSRKASGFLSTSTNTMTLSWSDRRQKDNPEEAQYLPFELTTTPPSLFRCRYSAMELSEDPVRARWSFACEASLRQAQEKLWSRRFFKSLFHERRRFVELSARELVVRMGVTPQRPLSAVEKGELEYLRRHINPSEARFYQALAEFEVQKLPWHPAWGCDWCERRITKSRILCLQCMAEDLSDNLDLCSVCIDKIPTKRGFVHDRSHDLIKVEETLHDFHFARVVEGAKETLVRVKGAFRVVEGMDGRMSLVDHNQVGDAPSDALDAAAHLDHLRCACCKNPVTTPCWSCLSCPKDAFVCLMCDSKKLLAAPDGPAPDHQLNHPLIRIRDSMLTGAEATIDERLSAMIQRMATLEHKLNSSLAAMDAKVEERLARIEHIFEQRMNMSEANAELRFDRLEAVLRQVVAQTAALPSMYTQIVKEQLKSAVPQPARGRFSTPRF